MLTNFYLGMTIAVPLFWLLLKNLVKKTNLIIYKTEFSLRRILPLSLAVLLAVGTIIFVDLNGGFPQNINVLYPQSLLFYPLVGLLAEMLLHTLPLWIFLVYIPRLSKVHNRGLRKSLIYSIAILEPVFQLILGQFTGLGLWWAQLYTFINVYIFNVIQLHIFKRYDWMTMYLFRLVYYLIWHIVWGQLRLEIIF